MSRTPAVPPFRLLSALYADDAMTEIWSERCTISRWLEVEAALAMAQADAGILDLTAAEEIALAASEDCVDADLLWEQARHVGYPILPLVRMIAAVLPDGPNGRVHFGATTQDIMDTALSLQLGASADHLHELLLRFGNAVAELVVTHRESAMPGRTHAQQAVPTTFGAKMAGFLEETRRHTEEMARQADSVRVVSLYGGGGTNAALGPSAAQVREALASRLLLHNEDIPWHVSRDRLARFGATCALAAATMTRFAREIIDLSRSEVAEVREQNGYHRGASSTMPQKINPIFCEAVIGFSVTASYASGALLRAMEAGHERAAGEWQVEWLVLPEVAEATAAAIRLNAETAANLQVFPKVMRRNLDADGGLLMAEAYMMRLAGTVGRERAHDIVYQAAEAVRRSGGTLAQRVAEFSPPSMPIDVVRVSPDDYIGEAYDICDVAVSKWLTLVADTTQQVANSTVIGATSSGS